MEQRRSRKGVTRKRRRTPQEKACTGKITEKPYRCMRCRTEHKHSTNHWGYIYPYCSVCGTTTEWECLEAVPDGMTIPPRWRMCKLCDIATIKEF